MIYFISIIFIINYISSIYNSFYKVSYKQEVGYVKKENVTCVYSTPTTPFPVDITFKANDITSISILDTPSVNGNYLGSILCGSYAEFYGEVAGDEAIKNLGNTWFYISYTQNDKQILGYVYAPLTSNLTPIKENLETYELLKNYDVEIRNLYDWINNT